MRRHLTILASSAALVGCAQGNLEADARMIDSAVVFDAERIDGPPPDACTVSPKQVLLNPSFDLTPRGRDWMEMPQNPMFPVIQAPPMGVTAPSTPNLAWLGGAPSATDEVMQQIVVPASATKFEVAGKILIGSQDTSGVVHDTLAITIKDASNTVLATVSSQSNVNRRTDGTYQAFAFTAPMSFAGQTVRFSLKSQTDATLNSNFFVDDLTVTITACQ